MPSGHAPKAGGLGGGSPPSRGVWGGGSPPSAGGPGGSRPLGVDGRGHQERGELLAVATDGRSALQEYRAERAGALWATEEIRRKYGGNPADVMFTAAKVRKNIRINQIFAFLS